MFCFFLPESDSVCFSCKNNLHLNKLTIINMIRADFVHRPSALEMKVKILSGCENTRVTGKTHGPLVVVYWLYPWILWIIKPSFYIYRSDERKSFNTYWWYRNPLKKKLTDLSLHSVNRDDTDHEKLTSHPFHITFIDKKLAAVKVSSYL